MFNLISLLKRDLIIEHIKVFEYAMTLWLKIKKEEYADYIRAITPLIVNLYEMILKKECNIDLDSLVNIKMQNGQKIKKWSKSKIQRNNPEIIRILDNADEYKNGFKYETVYSNAIAVIIRELTNDNTLKKNIAIMTSVEKNIRNPAAHTIISVSDEDIKKWLGYNSEQIFDLIKYFCIKAGISLKTEMWNTYIKMNEDIEGEINI